MLRHPRRSPPSAQQFDTHQALRMSLFVAVLTGLIGGSLALLLPDFGIQWLLWLVGFVVAAGIVSSDEPPMAVGAIAGLGVLGLLFYMQQTVQLDGLPFALALGVALAIALGVAFLVYRLLRAMGLDFPDTPEG